MHHFHAKNTLRQRRPAGRRQRSARSPRRPDAVCIALLLVCTTAGCYAPWWQGSRACEIGYASNARGYLSYRDHSLGPPDRDGAGYHPTIWDELGPIGPLPDRAIIGAPTPAVPQYEELPGKAPPATIAEPPAMTTEPPAMTTEPPATTADPPDAAWLPQQPDSGPPQLPHATAQQQPDSWGQANDSVAISRWSRAERRAALSPNPNEDSAVRHALHGARPERPMIAFRDGSRSSYLLHAPRAARDLDAAQDLDEKPVASVHTRPAHYLTAQGSSSQQRPDTGANQAVRFVPLPAVTPASRSDETPASSSYETPANYRSETAAQSQHQPPADDGCETPAASETPADRGQQPVTNRDRRTPAHRLLQRLESTARSGNSSEASPRK